MRTSLTVSGVGGAGVLQTGSNELVVGLGVRIVGTVTAPGCVRLLGSIEGDLESAEVVVAATGRLQGSLTAQRVEICGRVSNVVKGTESVVIRSTALVEGDLSYATLEMEAGARVHGTLRRISGELTNPPADSGIQG